MHRKTGKKLTDQLCGRLIVWDVDAPLNDLVVPATDYCHPTYKLDPQLRPRLPEFLVSEENVKAFHAALEKALKRKQPEEENKK